MAFCNSCGTQLESSSKFCPKCGAATPMTGTHMAAPASQAPQNSGLKIVLIVVAIVIGLGIIGSATAGFIAWHFSRRSHIQTGSGNVKVETPFGTVESTTNGEEATRKLGIALYPGARALKGQSANAKIGNITTTAAEFETSDSPDKVAEFYKSQFPHANVAVAGDNQYTIVNSDKKNIVTINIRVEEGTTHIHIASVTGQSGDGDSHD